MAAEVSEVRGQRSGEVNALTSLPAQLPDGVSVVSVCIQAVEDGWRAGLLDRLCVTESVFPWTGGHRESCATASTTTTTEPVAQCETTGSSAHPFNSPSG